MNRIVTHTLIGAAVALLLGCETHCPNDLNQTTLAQAGFEADEGYMADQPLVGQQGWSYGGWRDQLRSTGQGVATNLLPGSPQQAFLGGVSGAPNAGVYVGLSHAVSKSPASIANGIVEFNCKQRITDSTNGARNYFEWVFYDQLGQLLCGLVFDNASRQVLRRQWDNSTNNSGMTFVRDKVYSVNVRLDFKNNLWTARIGTTAMPPQPIVSKVRPLSLGSFSPVWWSGMWQAPFPGGPVAGDNRMVFDDVTVSLRE